MSVRGSIEKKNWTKNDRKNKLSQHVKHVTPYHEIEITL